MYELAKLHVAVSGRRPADRLHALDIRMKETLAQHSLTDHSGGAEKKHVHAGM